MLYATVRSGREALHFVAEVTPYNVQTLQQHVRGTLRDRGRGDVLILLDPSDAQAWNCYAHCWLSRLTDTGVPVRVQIVEPRRPVPVCPFWTRLRCNNPGESIAGHERGSAAADRHLHPSVARPRPQ